jgi:hypothetical protein
LQRAARCGILSLTFAFPLRLTWWFAVRFLLPLRLALRWLGAARLLAGGVTRNAGRLEQHDFDRRLCRRWRKQLAISH